MKDLKLMPQGFTEPYKLRYHYFSEVASTNQWLLEQGQCGDVCVADSQSAGRGRLGRSWQSPPGSNIYLSLRWCFKTVPPRYGLLSLVVGVAVAKALQAVGIQNHRLKWPNDIYCNGKKLGGILLQTAQPLEQVVVGIGLNVNMMPEDAHGIDQPWVSLAMMQGELLERDVIITALLKQLIPALQMFPVLGIQSFISEWEQWDMLIGQAVSVHVGNDKLNGIAQGIDEQGQLWVMPDSGSPRCFSAGDVSVRW